MSRFLTLRNGRRIVLNDADEEAAIEAGIKADPETYEPGEDHARSLRRRGRPPLEVTKQRVTNPLVARGRKCIPGNRKGLADPHRRCTEGMAPRASSEPRQLMGAKVPPGPPHY